MKRPEPPLSQDERIKGLNTYELQGAREEIQHEIAPLLKPYEEHVATGETEMGGSEL